jgi:hypothetical protein
MYGAAKMLHVLAPQPNKHHQVTHTATHIMDIINVHIHEYHKGTADD